MAAPASTPYIYVALYQLKICFHLLHPIYSAINPETDNRIILFANEKLRHKKAIYPGSHDQETPDLG